jgi:hypothetical protein
MIDFSIEVLIYSLLLITLSLVNIIHRSKYGLFLTAVTGFHFTFLLFNGIGYLFFFFTPLTGNPRFRAMEMRNMPLIGFYLVLGYILVSFIEWRKLRNYNISLNQLNNQILRNNQSYFTVSLMVLSFIGFFMSGSELASSSFGTIFPLLNYFFYPITILTVINLKKEDRLSIFLFVFQVIIGGINTFYSTWRSQLIIFVGSLLIGFYLRRRLNLYFLTLVSIIFFIIVLPFQQFKRWSGSQSETDTFEILRRSTEVSYEKRFLLISQFITERINYMREMVYVQEAIDNGRIEYKYGETYLNVFYQLIPRYFWDEKPTNRYINYEVPRLIGLLSWQDESTSWAVNSYAEFIYNFSYHFLPLFVLIIYLILNWFDTVTSRIEILFQYRWLLSVTLFFLSLSLVSVVYSSTYFMWLFIVVILLDKIHKSINANSAVR